MHKSLCTFQPNLPTLFWGIFPSNPRALFLCAIVSSLPLFHRVWRLVCSTLITRGRTVRRNIFLLAPFRRVFFHPIALPGPPINQHSERGILIFHIRCSTPSRNRTITVVASAHNGFDPVKLGRNAWVHYRVRVWTPFYAPRGNANKNTIVFVLQRPATISLTGILI